MSFQVNDKVVCVDDNNQVNNLGKVPQHPVVRGQAYCIRGFDNRHGTSGALLLVGASSGLICGVWGTEVGFYSYRFRKIHPKAVTEVLQEAGVA